MRDALPDRCVAFFAGRPKGALRKVRSCLVPGAAAARARIRACRRHHAGARARSGDPAAHRLCAAGGCRLERTLGRHAPAPRPLAGAVGSCLRMDGAGRDPDGHRLVDGALPPGHREPVAAILLALCRCRHACEHARHRFRVQGCQAGNRRRPGRLVISGRIVNITSHELSVPPIVVSLTDADKRELYHWTFPTGVTTLGPGKSAPFRTACRARRRR